MLPNLLSISNYFVSCSDFQHLQNFACVTHDMSPFIYLSIYLFFQIWQSQHVLPQKVPVSHSLNWWRCSLNTARERFPLLRLNDVGGMEIYCQVRVACALEENMQ